MISQVNDDLIVLVSFDTQVWVIYWTYGTSVFITAAAAATVLFSQHFKQ